MTLLRVRRWWLSFTSFINERSDQLVKKGKLTPKFNRMLEVLERVGVVAYRLELPQKSFYSFSVFFASKILIWFFSHFSSSWKCKFRWVIILYWASSTHGWYKVKCLDTCSVKVLSQETTWRSEITIREKYLSLLETQG